MQVFNSLPSALPTFSEWLNYSAGVNINKTVEVSFSQERLAAWGLWLGAGCLPGCKRAYAPCVPNALPALQCLFLLPGPLSLLQ